MRAREYIAEKQGGGIAMSILLSTNFPIYRNGAMNLRGGYERTSEMSISPCCGIMQYENMAMK